MAAFIPLAELSDRQQITILLSALGTICTGMFAAFCWLVKLSVSREIARMDKLAKERSDRERDQDRNIEWIKTILTFHGLTPLPGPPPGNI